MLIQLRRGVTFGRRWGHQQTRSVWRGNVAYVKCRFSLPLKHVNTVLMISLPQLSLFNKLHIGQSIFPVRFCPCPGSFVFACRVHRFSISKDRILLVIRGRFRFLLSWGIHSIAVPVSLFWSLSCLAYHHTNVCSLDCSFRRVLLCYLSHFSLYPPCYCCYIQYSSHTSVMQGFQTFPVYFVNATAWKRFDSLVMEVGLH